MHKIDKILRGICKQTSQSCLFIVDPCKDVFLKDLAESLIKVDWHMRGKYGPLCSVASAVGARCMLGWYPDIPREILRIVGDRAVAPHVSGSVVCSKAFCLKTAMFLYPD